MKKKLDLLHVANGTVKWYIQCKKQLVVLKEKMGLSYDPVIILLGIYLLTMFCIVTCTQMILQASFVIAQTIKH